jgi:ADP-ribosylglycohydrolase
VGEWPLRDYISEGVLEALGRRHRSWPATVRERIRYVAPDDDLNYAIIGMLLLEEKGAGFTKHDVVDLWLRNLPPGWTFGPERALLIKAATHTLSPGGDPPFETWVTRWNPGNELCGAAIRVDAYGYACPGRPALAAELAWRDASWTHRRTGVYGAMFVAAAIASAFVLADRMAIFETALQFVPRRSRFYQIAADCLAVVAEADDWLDGYARIHARYGQYGHCQIYQEVGTLINTMRFAANVDEGICMQVAQGNDTDCFGEIIGSLLGAHLGPGHLSERWLAPFNDDIRTALADFHERSLSAVAARMGALPRLISFEEGVS